MDKKLFIDYLSIYCNLPNLSAVGYRFLDLDGIDYEIDFEIKKDYTELNLLDDSISFSYSFIKKSKLFKDTINLFSGYGEQFKEGIELEDISNFITDFYSIKYIARKSAVSNLDVINVIVSISNLLRESEKHNINEIFLGSIRLQKAKGKKYWVLVER